MLDGLTYRATPLLLQPRALKIALMMASLVVAAIVAGAPAGENPG